MNRESLDQRFRLTVGSDGCDGIDLEVEVARGLGSTPKRLPCRLFYDEAGSQLFEEICELPEYYLTRAEDQILASHAAEIATCVPAGSRIVELGSGSAKKTRRLIEAFLARSGEVTYSPIDISLSMLESSSRRLLAAYSELSIHALAADYVGAVEWLRAESQGSKIVLWLGSNVGNFDRADAARFLSRLASCLGAHDRLLVGIDLRKSKQVLERAYDDSRGVTARFNLNLLARINRELGGHFDLGRFRHVAVYDEIEGKIEMHLESLAAQRVAIDRPGTDVPFARGERIHTEDSYKYSPHEIAELCAAAELAIARQWFDAERRFGLHLLAPRNPASRAPVSEQ
jgi:dimethylhistidine N-methyltransferase